MSTSLVPMQISEGAFAHSLGFEAFDDLLEASEPLFSPVGELWFVTPLPGSHCMAWSFPDYGDVHQFDSHEEALDFVQPGVLV